MHLLVNYLELINIKSLWKMTLLEGWGKLHCLYTEKLSLGFGIKKVKWTF